jgi:hypothetical protein
MHYKIRDKTQVSYNLNCYWHNMKLNEVKQYHITSYWGRFNFHFSRVNPLIWNQVVCWALCRAGRWPAPRHLGGSLWNEGTGFLEHIGGTAVLLVVEELSTVAEDFLPLSFCFGQMYRSNPFRASEQSWLRMISHLRERRKINQSGRIIDSQHSW